MFMNIILLYSLVFFRILLHFVVFLCTLVQDNDRISFADYVLAMGTIAKPLVSNEEFTSQLYQVTSLCVCLCLIWYLLCVLW